MRRGKPGWSKYEPDGCYPLHVLVALLLDINPEEIVLERDRDDPELREFWGRMREAEEAVRAGRLLTMPGA